VGKVEIRAMIMRSKFYLCAYGNEGDIRALYDYLKLQDSEIKPLKFKLPSASSDQDVQWKWRTSYQECSSDFPEDELEVFLEDNASLLQQLKTHRESLYELVGMIVCQLNDGEQPRGYSISPNLMRLLSNMDASLEIDIVAERGK
jgi:hypothetical protein